MRVRPRQLLCLPASMVSLLALAASATPASAAPDPVNAEPAVVPALQNWQGRTGFFELSRHSRIVFAGAHRDRLHDQLATFPDEIEQVTGRRPTLSPPGPEVHKSRFRPHTMMNVTTAAVAVSMMTAPSHCIGCIWEAGR